MPELHLPAIRPPDCTSNTLTCARTTAKGMYLVHAPDTVKMPDAPINAHDCMEVQGNTMVITAANGKATYGPLQQAGGRVVPPGQPDHPRRDALGSDRLDDRWWRWVGVAASSCRPTT